MKEEARYAPRRTRIVCTMGPACATEETVLAMIEAGMDVARLNFSHGDERWRSRTLRILRECEGRSGRPLGILADLQGPKIRVGLVAGGKVRLEVGEKAVLKHAPEGWRSSERLVIPTPYPYLCDDVREGERILLCDGEVELRATEVGEDRVVCEVVYGGEVSDHKGMNLPDSKLSVSSLTEKDKRDLRFVLENDFDFVALSFVASEEDVLELKRLIHSAGKTLPVVAKIERREALRNLEAIVEHADAVMVARGDLGVEIPTEEVPIWQKRIIGLCNVKAVPVITATQMLESMIHSPRPTRAEASDVANAVFDGTDALMLSGETASGAHPVLAVRTMAGIAFSAETSSLYRRRETYEIDPVACLEDTTAHAAVNAALDVGARCIVCHTCTGATARRVSSYRPPVPIHAFTPSRETLRRLSLVWGVAAHSMEADSMEEFAAKSDSFLCDEGAASRGDTVVLIAGIPFGRPGSTDTLKLHMVESLPSGAREAGDEAAMERDGVALDRNLCIGCGTCVTICPVQVWRMDSLHYAELNAENAARCMHDGLCAKNCPTGAIRIEERGTDAGDSDGGK